MDLSSSVGRMAGLWMAAIFVNRNLMSIPKINFLVSDNPEILMK